MYLPIAPRAVLQGLLASGNRADLLINCPEGDFNFTSTKVNDEPSGEPSSGSGESGSGSGSGEPSSGEPSSGPGESGSGSGSGEPSSGEPEEPNTALLFDPNQRVPPGVIEETLLFIRANKSPGDNQTCDLPVFKVNRPCCDRPPHSNLGPNDLHIASADPVFASCSRQTSSTCASKRWQRT